MPLPDLRPYTTHASPQPVLRLSLTSTSSSGYDSLNDELPHDHVDATRSLYNTLSLDEENLARSPAFASRLLAASWELVGKISTTSSRLHLRDSPYAMGNEGVVLAFDLYGTVFDTGSCGHALGRVLPLLADASERERLGNVLTTWRREQLEYTWRLNSMERYIPFDEVTILALNAALAQHGLPQLSEEGKKRMLEAYNHLARYAGADNFFESLRSRHTKAVFFSNGTVDMVKANLSQSDIMKETFLSSPDGIVSVDQSARRYKPHPAVYQDLLTRVGRDAKDVILVSSNPFDIVGAMRVGLRAIWVDRTGKGWTDQLGPAPTWSVRNLGDIMWVLEEAEER